MAQKFNYLIIGGGIAGTTAAETIRKSDEGGTIAIVSDEPYRLYSRVMLSKPNLFLGKIPLEQIELRDQDWYEQNRIELLNGQKVVGLDVSQKEAILADASRLGYEKLLLAIGGSPRRWDVPGSEKRGIFYLRTLDDAKAIIAAIKSAKSAIIIGGGFVSFEMCDILRLAGLPVTLLLRESYYWEPLLDEPSGHLIEEVLEKGGVKILRRAEVSEVIGDKAVEGVILKDGAKISGEMIIAGIGIICLFDWLKEAGLKVNRGILANEYLETNLPDVWTAGDAAEFDDLILGESVQLGNWINAQMQGKIAGLNMTGKKEPFRLISFYTTQGFGITIVFVGDARPDAGRLIIPRGSAESGSYGRILIKDGEIVGATLVNRTAEISAISKLIEKDIKVTGHEKELADADFDLAGLMGSRNPNAGNKQPKT